MKALRVHSFGPAANLVVEETPVPTPSAEEVLVQIHRAGVNPVDTYIRSGAYAALPPLPYTPGHDGAGVVTAVGHSITNWQPGDRVYLAGSLSGTYAEYALCRPDQIFPLPEATSFDTGAALGIPYATAAIALFHHASLTPSQHVLVRGAGGGVGFAAIQLALDAKAKPIAIAGSPAARASLATLLGADHVIDSALPPETIEHQVLQITNGKGVELLLETAAQDHLGADLRLLAQEGTALVVGSRGTATILPRDLMARNASLRGVMLMRCPAPALAAAHARIARLLVDGKLTAPIHATLPLAEGARAHEMQLERGLFGKILLAP
jgi:NADPH2:quinone reductase